MRSLPISAPFGNLVDHRKVGFLWLADGNEPRESALAAR